MHCGHCNTDLPAGMRADARYCSDACRLAAVTERRRAQRVPRKCAECGRDHEGRTKLCEECSAPAEHLPPHGTMLSWYGTYCDEIDALKRKWEASLTATALDNGMHDILYRWIATNTGPLTRHERRALRVEHGAGYGTWNDGWTFRIRNDMGKVLKKYIDNPEVIARLDEIAVRQKQLRRGLRPGQRGPYRFAT
jgi:hypothetical protein